ncbi:hypothetical protein QTP86_001881 [Hemibagrus guttatus]|nr:hypothetical protein QTP86_001881 [Hemibagrus guttatus]
MAFYEVLQDEIATREPAKDLEALIDLAVRLDNCPEGEELVGRQWFTPLVNPVPTEKLPLPHGSPEPIQLGGTRISPLECDHRMREQCCLYCGQSRHFRSTCPQLSGNAQSPYRQGRTVTGLTHITPPSKSGLFLLIRLTWGTCRHELKVLVDSGAAGKFMDISLVKNLQIPFDSLPRTPDSYCPGWKL